MKKDLDLLYSKKRVEKSLLLFLNRVLLTRPNTFMHCQFKLEQKELNLINLDDQFLMIKGGQ